MKIVRKANVEEVKRCFVISNALSGKKYKNVDDFIEQKKSVIQHISTLDESRLDDRIDYQRRVSAYNRMDWYLATVSPKELGVWKGAGKLPITWTDCTLAKTAQYVSTALKNNSRELKHRVKRIFPEIFTYVDSIYPEQHLRPIVFESNTGTMGKKGLKPTIGDIDDGSMRSIAFAMAGKKQITVYFGRVKPGFLAHLTEAIRFIFW